MVWGNQIFFVAPASLECKVLWINFDVAYGQWSNFGVFSKLFFSTEMQRGEYLAILFAGRLDHIKPNFYVKI